MKGEESVRVRLSKDKQTIKFRCAEECVAVPVCLCLRECPCQERVFLIGKSERTTSYTNIHNRSNEMINKPMLLTRSLVKDSNKCKAKNERESIHK